MGSFRDERGILSDISQGEQDIWEASLSYLNSLGWLLSWDNRNGNWQLYLNNRPVFIRKEWLPVQSFVYGMVLSSLNIAHRMKYRPKASHRLQDTSKINEEAYEGRSIIEIFDELVSTSELIFEYEMQFATPARAAFMYRAYQNQQYDPKYAEEFEQFATSYERKLDLEKILKTLSEKAVDRLKSSARQLKPILPQSPERLPVALAFLFLYLERKYSFWYRYKDKWFYFEGVELIFSADDRDDFEGFILGMAYNYAQLPEEVLEERIIGSR